MKMLSLVMSVLLSSSAAFAGGSIAKSDFIGAIGSKDLKQLIAGEYRLAEVGEGVRVGEQVFPGHGGERVLPFSIAAKSKATGKAVILTLENPEPNSDKLPPAQSTILLLEPCSDLPELCDAHVFQKM